MVSLGGQRLVRHLGQLLQGTGRFSVTPSVLEQHSFDESFKRVRSPLAVCFPTR